MPGSGKTAVGRAVADRLGCTFVDADDAVAERTGRAIADIFATDGERAFRTVEAATIADLVERDDIVLSLGGGAVLTPSTRHLLAAGCPVVWLRADVDTLAERMTAAEAADRPLLSGDVDARLAALDRERRAHYREVATVVIDAAAGIDDVAAAVVASLAAAPAT